MGWTIVPRAITALADANFVQLFNIKEDPREMKNLALDPAYSAVLQELQVLAANHIKTYRDVPGNHLFQVKNV